jgi:pantoate--beta-alanine ligase
MTTLVCTRDELRQARLGREGSTALVMTMGALHEGHAALLRQARLRAATVIVTVFVNPLQFSPGEDFDRYPRTLAGDLEICGREQADLVFAPGVEEVFAEPPRVMVDPGPMGDCLEGASRPGHFAGVLTVVNRMLHLTGGVDAAFFGEKDYQQLTLIRRMAADFALDLEVVGVPTVREPDGLALSSRNRYLSAPQRAAALALSAALRAGAGAAASGAAGAEVIAASRAISDAEPEFKLDYLVLRDPDLAPEPAVGQARLLIAGQVGGTRLIDNLAVQLQEGA